MALSIGAVLRSRLSPAEVVAVRAADPSAVVELSGQPMSAEGPPGLDGRVRLTGQLTVGRRYVHEPSGLELLCVRAGPGELTVGGEPLTLKATQPHRGHR
jgi:hypothetical protein